MSEDKQKKPEKANKPSKKQATFYSKAKVFVKKHWLILIIIIVATVLRFYNLGQLPPGLHPDEAANGLDVISILDNHKLTAIFDTNGPRESLFIYLQAIFVWIGEVTQWSFLNFTPLSLRIAPAIIGVVTIFGIYLLGKELFNKNVGTFAAAAMAVSAWHIQFSRNGFRAIMAPLALVFLFYFFIRAYRSGKFKDYIWTGIFLAIGFYTYLSFRMVPLVLIALLVFILISDKKFIKKNLSRLGYLTAAFLIIMLPMLIHFIHVPADILGRSSTSIFNPETNGGSPIKALFDNVIKTAMMFNFAGDKNFRHNLGGTPMLDIFAGILFWFGVVISLVRVKKIEYFLLIMWFGALSLPELLTSEGIPHALRIVGVMPVVFLWIALGLNWIMERLKIKKSLYVGTALILLISGTLGVYKYFIQFPKHAEAREAYAENMVEIANDMNKQDKSTQIILIAGEYGTKTIQFMTHSKKPAIRRYEVYTIKGITFPKGHYKMYIETAWANDAMRELEKVGFSKGMTPVPSKVDNRILYYEYSK